MITVVDYDAGNLTSVVTALDFLQADYLVTDDPEKVLKAEKIIFPGVGEAGSAMEHLNKTGLTEALRSYAGKGNPLFGICLGAQIVMAHSEESDTPCLNLIPGDVKKFPSSIGLKIPQIGWNPVETSDIPLFLNVPKDTSFYFVHSYYVSPERDEDIIGTADYGINFCAAIQRDNIIATQFHPEKSGKEGLLVLKNYIDNY